MGSIDPGPYYLGSGELATAPAATRRDLRKAAQRGYAALRTSMINAHWSR
jgi:hypothetical protein